MKAGLLVNGVEKKIKDVPNRKEGMRFTQYSNAMGDSTNNFCLQAWVNTNKNIPNLLLPCFIA